MTRYHGCDCAYCPVDPKDEEGGNPVSDLIEELTRQRDDAQDEIERLISELAEKRIQIEVLEARPPLVRVVDIRDEGSCVVAEGSHWHVDGGGS